MKQKLIMAFLLLGLLTLAGCTIDEEFARAADHGVNFKVSNPDKVGDGDYEIVSLGDNYIAFLNSQENYFNDEDGVAKFMDFSAEDKDLVYAVSKNYSGEVDLFFRSALSQISFTFQLDSPVYESVEVISIELEGIKGKGTYILPTYESGRGKWNLDENSLRSYKLENVGLVVSEKGKKIDLPSKFFYLLPQKTEDMILKITEQITLKDFPENSYISTEEVILGDDWKEGKKYNYTFVWNSFPITFDVSIDEFCVITEEIDL